MIYMLSIEVDAHINGGPAPRPWVAEITGADPKYGLARAFVTPHNDWADASVSWRGRTHGVVARFALHDGRLYEASRCRGRTSRRYMAREFYAIEAGKRTTLEPSEALARVTGGTVQFRIDEDRDGRSWVARVTGLGTPERQAFVVVDERKLYYLSSGLYEVVELGRRRFIGVGDTVERVTEQEAQQWLTPSKNR